MGQRRAGACLHFGVVALLKRLEVLFLQAHAWPQIQPLSTMTRGIDNQTCSVLNLCINKSQKKAGKPNSFHVKAVLPESLTENRVSNIYADRVVTYGDISGTIPSYTNIKSRTTVKSETL